MEMTVSDMLATCIFVVIYSQICNFVFQIQNLNIGKSYLHCVVTDIADHQAAKDTYCQLALAAQVQ